MFVPIICANCAEPTARLIGCWCPECCERILTTLRALESKQNDGRGVSCVRSVITYLERGDLESAQAVANTDHDKIRNYPEIANFLRKALWPLGKAPSWWRVILNGVNDASGNEEEGPSSGW